MAKTVRITVPSDGHGYFARECPVCNGFFKVTPGTGLTTETDPYCPYCGHRGPGDTFWTAEQIEFARSVLLNRIGGQFLQVVQPQDAQAQLGGGPHTTVRETTGVSPVRLYIDPACQTDICCPACTLRYAVYGPFRCCPDCGHSGRADIALANLDMAARVLRSAATGDADRRTDAVSWAQQALEFFAPDRERVRGQLGADPWHALARAAEHAPSAAREIAALETLISDTAHLLRHPDHRQPS